MVPIHQRRRHGRAVARDGGVAAPPRASGPDRPGRYLPLLSGTLLRCFRTSSAASSFVFLLAWSSLHAWLFSFFLLLLIVVTHVVVMIDVRSFIICHHHIEEANPSSAVPPLMVPSIAARTFSSAALRCAHAALRVLLRCCCADDPTPPPSPRGSSGDDDDACSPLRVRFGAWVLTKQVNTRRQLSPPIERGSYTGNALSFGRTAPASRQQLLRGPLGAAALLVREAKAKAMRTEAIRQEMAWVQAQARAALIRTKMDYSPRRHSSDGNKKMMIEASMQQQQRSMQRA